MSGTFTITMDEYPTKWYRRILPYGNPHQSDFSPYPRTNQNWQNVYAFPFGNYDDSTYNYSMESDGEEFYEIDYGFPFSQPPPSGDINYVRIHERLRANYTDIDNIPNVYISITDNAGTNQYNSSKLKITDYFMNYSYSWAENPRTAASWTWANLLSGSFEAGVVFDSASEGCNVFLADTDDEGQHCGTGVSTDGSYIYTCLGIGEKMYAYTFDGDSLTQVGVTDTGHDFFSIYVDSNDYIHVASLYDGIRGFTFNGSNFSYIDGDWRAAQCISGDGTYIYTAQSSIGTQINAYSWDGSDYTHIDVDNDGKQKNDIYCDGSYIYCACGGDGLRAYSFDGANIAYINSIDNGGYYNGVSGDGTYIYCACDNSGIRAYTFNGANFTLVGERSGDGTVDDAFRNVIAHGGCIYVTQYEPSPYGSGSTMFVYEFDGSEFTLKKTIGSLNYRQFQMAANGEHVYASSYSGLSAFNLGLFGAEISYVYIEVGYNDTKTCTLNKPHEISTSHRRNIKKLNFWTGDREVYDVNRSGKSIVLNGSEYYDGACDRIQCLRDLGLVGGSVTIAGLNPNCFNGDYKIRSLGWKEISKSPEHFEYILELESEE